MPVFSLPARCAALLGGLTVLAALLLAPGTGAQAATTGYAQPLGPDVSGWQHPNGAAINWTAVARAGQSFAFVKASESTTYVNPYFPADWAGIAAAGMKRGAYHFARPAYPLSTAADQARAFVRVTGLMQRNGDMPPALDLESAGSLSPRDLVTWAHSFLDTVQALTGRVPIVYTYPYFWRTAMADDTGFTRYPLWIADYSGGTPTLVGGWRSWTLWQYSDSGSLPGISGPVDLNRYCCGVALATFAGGSTSAILTRYASLGGSASFLGPVTSAEYAVTGGRAQNFAGGSIYWSAALGAHVVAGAIRERYWAMGGSASPLGLPVTDELGTPGGGGRYNHFAAGSIYWTPGTGAHALQGEIRARWAAQGWERGPLGYPVTDETGTPDGRGRYNHFSAGSIYWAPSIGAHSVQGEIRNKWAAQGWERGPLGYPVTDETGTPDGVGRYNHFVAGSVYYAPGTGAHSVLGAIRAAWAARGWERSDLGYPVSDEFPVAGGAQSNFQRNALRWAAAGNSVTVVRP